MKITSDISDERVQLVFDGRLDAAWSEPASAALDEAIRSGRSRIELDLAGVTFISSVGIGVILRANARFRAVKGVLTIIAASESVRDMLKISRLETLIHSSVPKHPASHAPNHAPNQAPSHAPNQAPSHAPAPVAFGNGWTGLIQSIAPVSERAQIEFVRSARITLDANTLALGHFALANSIDEASGLYGEGVAAGGTVAVAPATAPRPDCLFSSSNANGELQRFVSFIARDTLVVRGRPAFHAHFERSTSERITLSSLASALVDAAGCAVAFIAIGESGGAFGAWARQSPDSWPRPVCEMSPDEMREALRFAGDPMHAGESIAVVGVACQSSAAATLPAPVAAALHDAGSCLLHAHVATVSYRPVPRATIELRAVGELLAEQPLRTVMHALRIEGVGVGASADIRETTFVRGSVWVMRIGTASTGGAS